MKQLFPKTLTSQTILVLLIGLTLSHVISMIIYSDDRVEALTLMGGRNMAQRIANISHLAIESPPEWRSKIISAVDEQSFRVWLTPKSMITPSEVQEQHADVLKEYLSVRLGITGPSRIQVQLLELPHEGGALSALSPNRWMHLLVMQGMYGITRHQSLRVSLELAEGQWLNFATDIPEATPFWSTTSLLSLLSMAAAVIILSVWVVRRLTGPLRSFGQAAKRLGKDVNAPSLDESGPKEVSDAAKAFNDMQDRLKRLIDNRTQMLAAISHDLRTPITLLRLRTELIDDLEEKSKMLATLDDMEKMVASTLDFARQDAIQEEPRKIDLTALLDSLSADAMDMGADVQFESRAKVLFDCRPVALKRALNNLIENAVKYGERARITLVKTRNSVEITVEDHGPGIDDAEIEQVFQPFYRCEKSRSRATGGYGLGLSVAQSVAHAHGGEIILSNNPEKGLKAVLRLPS